MTIYEKVITSVMATKSLLSHIKDLGKIKLESEDSILISHLNKLVQSLQMDYRISTAKSLPLTLENTKDSAAVALIQYCQKNIVNHKPEWQIIAERHGWGLLNKKDEL